ncbi:hypothetical protein AM588_10000222 [Phytophthora nicotianae]|uniref:Uncharacterized protein n=1 Tax=Phytophthora nicotianae TaxID=4792 RepID=A0A0W8CAJ0_PHYNI|nr:hypothetical protein AM588_10000222 [Phytophthora nicotianae]
MAIPTALKCRTRKNRTPAERAEVIAYLLSVSTELSPPQGAIKACATKYACGDAQISRLWRRSVKTIQAGAPIDYESGRRVEVAFRVQLNEAIELIPLEDRTDIRTLASSLGIAKTIEDLVNNVDSAFKELHYTKLDSVFLTLHSVLQASMRVDGCNKYNIPHLSKDKLRADTGLFLPSLACTSSG